MTSIRAPSGRRAGRTAESSGARRPGATELRQTVINAHLPIERDGAPARRAVRRGHPRHDGAAMSTSSRPRSASRSSCCRGATASWRHRVSTPSSSAPSRPLPLLAEVGDPVLAAMWAGSTEAARASLDRRRARRGAPGRRRRAQDWVVLYREIAGLRRPALDRRHLPAGQRRRRRDPAAVAGAAAEPRLPRCRRGRHVLARPAHGAPGRAAGRGRAAHPEARARRGGRAAAQPHQRAGPRRARLQRHAQRARLVRDLRAAPAGAASSWTIRRPTWWPRASSR